MMAMTFIRSSEASLSSVEIFRILVQHRYEEEYQDQLLWSFYSCRQTSNVHQILAPKTSVLLGGLGP